MSSLKSKKTTTNIKDLAEMVGVSKTTISIFLNTPETTRISNEVKAKIKTAIEETGFTRSVIAHSLALQKTKTICVLALFKGHNIFESNALIRLMDGIQSSLSKEQYSLLIPPAKDVDIVNLVKHQHQFTIGYDGLIICATRYDSTTELALVAEYLEQTNVPTILINAPYLEQDLSQIIIRTPEKSCPINYLVRNNHKKIVFILGYKDDPDTEEILKKIRRVEKTENIKIETKNILYGKYSSSKAKDCLAKYIEANGLDFSAVYAHSFKMIQGVYELFFERKIAIPDDISVIGTSHDASDTILYPPLTFLERPYYDVGRLAVEE